MPLVLDRANSRYAPKYASVLKPSTWNCVPYKHGLLCLVKCDTSEQQNNTLVAFNDVLAFPRDSSSLLGSEQSKVSLFLEALGFPGTWTSVNTSYDILSLFITRIFLFSQRLGEAFLPLDRSLSPTEKIKYDSICDSLKYARNNHLLIRDFIVDIGIERG